MLEALGEAVDQPLDRLRLVAGGLERGDELEVGHVAAKSYQSAHEPNRRSDAS